MVKEDQVKVFALLPRRADVSDEYFHEHWIHPHGTWATEMDPLKRYVQNHRIESGLDGLASSSYEGIAIVWFDDLEAAVTMGEDPTYKEKVQPDEPLFIDMDGLAFTMTDEYVLRVGPAVAKDDPKAVKPLILLHRAEGLEPAEFAERLAAKAEALSGLFADARRLTLAVNLPVNYEGEAPPACDAVIEAWFDDAESFGAAWERDREALFGELDGLVDRDATQADLHEEMRFIWPASERAGAA